MSTGEDKTSADGSPPSGDSTFEAPKILSRPEPKVEKPEVPVKPPPLTGMRTLVAVTFHDAGKLYDFESAELELKTGDHVLVETDEGLSMARIAIKPRQEDVTGLERPLRKVIRKCTFDDMRQQEKNKDREKRAYEVCRQKIKEARLPMKLVQAEYLHSGSKAIFYFTSEERVDFRRLVKELAQEIHTRVEMRQIGPRDETKIMGGIGVCGRELCCTTWLRDFDPVSIKMAKEQELSLNQSKLAGQCGRLKCCLAYEYETYAQAKKGLPKAGKKVCWKNGDPCGRVIGHNIFTNSVRVLGEDGVEKLVPLSDVQLAMPAGGAKPAPDAAEEPN